MPEQISKNDNELLGLPKDIDLVETAIDILKTNPSDLRRVKHLKDVMERLLLQVDEKIIELENNN